MGTFWGAPVAGVGREGGVGVLPSGSSRVITRRVVMSRDSPRLKCDGARNTRI